MSEQKPRADRDHSGRPYHGHDLSNQALREWCLDYLATCPDGATVRQIAAHWGAGPDDQLLYWSMALRQLALWKQVIRKRSVRGYGYLYFAKPGAKNGRPKRARRKLPEPLPAQKPVEVQPASVAGLAAIEALRSLQAVVNSTVAYVESLEANRK